MCPRADRLWALREACGPQREVKGKWSQANHTGQVGEETHMGWGRHDSMCWKDQRTLSGGDQKPGLTDVLDSHRYSIKSHWYEISKSK